MGSIFLGINYGCYEGWKLTEFPSADDALQAVKDGDETYGNEWKILRELDIEIKETEND